VRSGESGGHELGPARAYYLPRNTESPMTRTCLWKSGVAPSCENTFTPKMWTWECGNG